MIDPEKMRLFMQALKPDLPGLARQVFIENPQTAMRELPGKLQASRDLLNQYEPGKGIDPRLMDQFMNLTGSFAPMGMTANVTKQVAPSLLDTINPTGSVFTKYDPSFRATAEIGPSLTTYNVTNNINPDDFVTIYRGVPSGVKSINAGDFVTTNKQLATDYAGEGKVITKKVKASELLDDIAEPGEEYIYRPARRKQK